jgi:hypothetical protein
MLTIKNHAPFFGFPEKRKATLSKSAIFSLRTRKRGQRVFTHYITYFIYAIIRPDRDLEFRVECLELIIIKKQRVIKFYDYILNSRL